MREPLADFKSKGGLRSISESQPDDLLLVCYSFEPRSTVIGENLATDYAANVGIVYFNDDVFAVKPRTEATGGSDVLRHTLAAHVNDVRHVKGDILNSGTQLRAFRELFSHKQFDRESVKRITLDATAFNRETLLILFGLLDTFFPTALRRVVYVSPQSYGTWLSAGFREVRNVIGLAGLQDPSKKTLLIILYGYEPHRALKTIEEYEPSKVMLGFGGTPTDIDFLKRNRDELNQVKALVLSQQDTEDFDFPADSIANCTARLEEVIAPTLNDYNVVIAPMSTKLSTIATYLLAKKYPQIQVSYCVPGVYNTAEYSQGAKTVFVEELAAT